MQYYLLIVGLALSGFGIRLAMQRLNFFLRSRKTQGALSCWKETRGKTAGTIDYYYEVTFEDDYGIQHTATSSTASSGKPNKPIGHPIPVRYDPSDPDNACIDTVINLWIPSFTFLLMGGIALFAFFHPDSRHR